MYVSRIDCAIYGSLCAKYGVSRYPTMVIGWPKDILERDLKTLTKLEPAVRTLSAVRKAVAKELADMGGKTCEDIGSGSLTQLVCASYQNLVLANVPVMAHR